MPLHRLIPPTYLGGVPVTHNEINNATSGIPALADTVKVGTNPNAGTYFIAFGEDGTSHNGNRPHVALAENTDYLDDIVNTEVPVVDNVDVTAGGGGDASLLLAGDVFVGKSGTANNSIERDRLIKVVDQVTGNDIIDASGVTVKASLIHNGAAANQVGVPASGFFTAPTINFSPAVPAGTLYRVFLGRRSSYRDISLDKTRLDAFTRQVIQGAHQVPGESLRFIREAGRRSGGSGSAVTALAAAIIETPGLGENLLPKSNTMMVDIDPDESFAFNGAFGVRYHRDGTPKTLFSVIEGASAGESEWRNTDEPVQLSDVNVLASGFGALRVPLSSGVAADGDDNLRLAGIDAGGTPVSILKRLNAAPVITCGNGTTTFGDFNGSTALTDAVTFLTGAGIFSYQILLKRGSYNVDNLDLSGAASVHHIIIEGETRSVGSGGATINCTNVLGPTSAGLTCTGGSNNIIELRNLKIQGTGELAVYLLNNFLLVDNCHTSNKGIRLDYSVDANLLGAGTIGGKVFKMVNSVLSWSASGSTPPLHYVFQDGTPDADGFIVEDCILQPPLDTTGQPVLKVENANITAQGLMSGVLFNRCTMVLGTCADAAGDMDGNSGVIELVPGTTSFMELGTVEWRDCNVTIRGVGAHRPLMYARLSDGSGFIDAAGAAGIWRIIGGRWEASLGSVTSPFYIGLELAESGNHAVNRVYIENVNWGFPGSAINGASTAEVGPVTTAGWAAFYIAASQVIMRNVTWLGNTALSDSGDLYIDACRRLTLDGVYLGSNNWNAGAAAAPEFRVKVVIEGLVQFGVSSIRNLMITPSFTNGQSSLGLLQLTRATNAVRALPCSVSDCSISGNATVGGALIYVAGGAVTREEGNGWHFNDCRLEDCAGDGFFFDWSVAGREPLRDLRITNCTVIDCDEAGIHFDFGAAEKLGDVAISGCRLEDCASAFGGLYVEGTAPWDEDETGLTLRDNHYDGNGGSRSGVQLFIEDLNAAVGSIYGNISAAIAGTPGFLATLSGPSDHFRGTETGYTYTGGAGGAAIELIQHTVTASSAVTNKRNHRNNIAHELMHNRLRFSAP